MPTNDEPDVFRVTRAMDMRLLEDALTDYGLTHPNAYIQTSVTRLKSELRLARKEIEREWSFKAAFGCTDGEEDDDDKPEHLHED